MWTGDAFDKRGNAVGSAIYRMELAINGQDREAALEAAETVRTNMQEVMAQYRAMHDEVNRQELGGMFAVRAMIRNRFSAPRS